MNAGTQITLPLSYSKHGGSTLGRTSREGQGLSLPQGPLRVGVLLWKSRPLPTSLVQWCINAFPKVGGKPTTALLERIAYV